MIKVDGEKIEIAGSDMLLMRELAYLIAVVRSRVNSRGYEDATADSTVIEPAVMNAKLYTLDYLRSEAKMCASVEMYGRYRKDGATCIMV